MRLDKFLKVSRIIKRRIVAKEVSEQSRIEVNGNVAKASTTLKEGDIITIKFGQKLLTVRVKDIKDSSKKEEAKEMYEVLSEKLIQKNENN